MSAHQLDSGHLCTVTLAVASLQDARVSTGTRSELRADFIEQLIVEAADLDVTAGEAPVVQRAGARLGDQSFDERTELLRSRFGRLDRATLDQSHGETSHKSQLLLGCALERAAHFTVTHCLLLVFVGRSRRDVTVGRSAGVGDANTVRSFLELHTKIQLVLLEQV